MTDIRLSLSPTGDLRLTFPEHRERTLDFPLHTIRKQEPWQLNSMSAEQLCELVREQEALINKLSASFRLIAKVLRDADSGKRDQRGYVGLFPTQAIVDTWLRQAAVDRAAKVREDFADMGIDLDKVEFTL